MMREVPGSNGWYSAGSDGRIYSWKNNRWGRRKFPLCLRPVVGKNGYEYVAPAIGGRQQRVPVHQLVIRAFHGHPVSSGLEVRHLDGDRRNNKPENLAWGTRPQNIEDTMRHGRVPKGEIHHMAKLSEKDVRKIRSARGIVPTEELAQKYGVSITTIRNAQNYHVWGWLDTSKTDAPVARSSVFLNSEAVKVLRFFHRKVPGKILAGLHGVRTSTVCAAQLGRTWREEN